MRPRTAWINITDQCNNHCIWCYGNDSFTGKLIMPYSYVTQRLNWFASIKCKSCILIGGEPTLHPDFIKILTHGRKIGLEMAVISNGRRFSDLNFCMEVKKTGLEIGHITISMSSFSSESGKELAGSKESFDQFEKGFNNLNQIGLNPSINIVISKSTINYLDHMLIWGLEHKISNITFNQAAPSISKEGINSSFCLPPDKLAFHSYRLFKDAEKLALKSSILFNLPFCLLSLEEIQELFTKKGIRSGCGIRNGSSILFNVSGDLITCNHLPFLPVKNVNQVTQIFNENKFDNFWNNDIELIELRKLTSVYRSEKCKCCEFWDVCAGGCPIFWSTFDPKEYIRGF
ncbi:MAG: radical SAM protein [Anaerolineaceae bacterium]